jgi:esterase/lipase
VRWIVFIFLICHSTAFGFWNDSHIRTAWNEHRSEIEVATSAYASAQKGYKMAYWAANEAYKLAQHHDKLLLARSYLQLSANIFKSGAGFGGIKSTPIDLTTRDLARKTLTILGLMVKGNPFFSFEKKSTVLAKVQKHRAKEFVEKVQQIKLSQKIPAKPNVSETFLKEVGSFTDDNGKTILSELLRYEPISLFPSTLEEESLATDAHLGICPECKEMQTTSREMEEWWQTRIKEDPRGTNYQLVTAAFGDSFDSYRSSSLQYLKNGTPQPFSLDSCIGFNIYIPKNVKPGTPVVFNIYDGILANFPLHTNKSGFQEETVLAYAGCIVITVQGMGRDGMEEPPNIRELRYNYTNFPNQIFDDIEDIYTALRDQVFVKDNGSSYPKLIVPGKTKVFLHGSSFGGYMTMMAATSNYVMQKAVPNKPFRELFDGYIPYSGFYDWAQDQTNLENSKSNLVRGRFARSRDYTTRTNQDGNRFKIKQHTLYLASDPLMDHSINEKMSPIYHLDRLDRPVLLMHGVKDINVGVDAALNLLSKLSKISKRYLVDPVILPDHGHDIDAATLQMNRSSRVQFLKDYFDPILYFIRQIQDDERLDLERSKLKALKEKAQSVKLVSAERKLLNKQEKDRYQEDNPLAKLIEDLKQKLERVDATLIGLLRNPTAEKIIEFAKDIPIYKERTDNEERGFHSLFHPSIILNQESKDRLIKLFTQSIYTIAMEFDKQTGLAAAYYNNPKRRPGMASPLKNILDPDDLGLSSKTKPDSPFLWLEEKVLEDLKAEPRGYREWKYLPATATALQNLQKDFSDDNIIAYLKKLPNFFGIAGHYEMTHFFYKLKRKEIRQAIRYVLFPNEWLFDKLKVVLEEERRKEEEEKRQNNWYRPYIYLDGFPYVCEKLGKPGSSLPSEEEAESINYRLIRYLDEKLPNEPVRQRFSDIAPYTMGSSEFIKAVQGCCSRISEQVTAHREFMEKLQN